MIRVDICGTKQLYDSSLASWIHDQYHNRRRDGAEFWFIITIEAHGINLSFRSTSAPPGKGIPYSYFNSKEQKIIDMWNDMGVKQGDNISILLLFF